MKIISNYAVYLTNDWEIFKHAVCRIQRLNLEMGKLILYLFFSGRFYGAFFSFY